MKEAGFTLIELLAAMVAGSLLLVSLGWAVATLGERLVKARSDDEARAFHDAAALLVPLIEQASPRAQDGSGFRGTAQMLEVSVPPPMAAASAGQLRLRLRVVENSDGQSLMAQLVPTDPRSSLPIEAQEERRLLSGYRSFRFDYSPPPDGVPTGLPRLITLTALDAEGMVQRLSSAPRIHSDGRCRFDPGSLTCRY
jgi:prepilin-type N-terminal cleavage/methylation domain-containing protein